MAERVQKILAQWGIASRREAEKLILQQRVKINGRIVQLGEKVDLDQDNLEVDGQKIEPSARPKLIYLLLNKPLGVVCTCDDPQNRTTVLDLLPQDMRSLRVAPKGRSPSVARFARTELRSDLLCRSHQGIHPVGRLDADSTGALILTNNGELTLRLTHPRYHLPKTYHVWLKGHPSAAILQTWEQGVCLLGKKTLPAQIEVLDRSTHQTLIEVILNEGRNRQIRRVAQQLGFPVLKLHRLAIGSISLNHPFTLSLGEYRLLADSELQSL